MKEVAEGECQYWSRSFIKLALVSHLCHRSYSLGGRRVWPDTYSVIRGRCIRLPLLDYINSLAHLYTTD
jgi:hypothetical protein